MKDQESFHLCPRCEGQFSPQALRFDVLICSQCGWTPSDSELASNWDGDKKFFTTLVVGTLAFLVGFVHYMNWGQSSVEILPLKAKFWTGVIQESELLKLADLCEDRYKYTCSVSALEALPQSRQQLNAKIRLANLKRRSRQYEPAIQDYRSILEIPSVRLQGSQLADIYYGLAKSYEKLGNNESALHYYNRSIQAKPEVIQVTVTESYLRLLKRVGQSDRARAVIKEARKRGRSKEFFSNFEFSKSI